MTGCGRGENRRETSPASRAVPTATATSHGTAPRPLEECRSAGGGWQSLPTSGEYSPTAAHLGRGRVGVVFANDSDNDSCAWSGDARSLAEHEYAVAVFETVGGSGFEAKQVLAVARALRRTGVRRIAMIGASVGARAVLQAGAQHPRDVVGHRTIPHDRALILSGGNHGVELLRDRHRRRVRAAILAFLRSL
jgi:hypothetical protein